MSMTTYALIVIIRQIAICLLFNINHCSIKKLFIYILYVELLIT